MTVKRCPECLKYFEQVGDWQRICKRCYARAKRNRDSDTEDSSNGYVIPKPLMKKVRQLVHPDRHGGSQLANSVMAELNKLMGR
ncbi:hypothetical protein A1359_07915 [Methylomonas lenta]|uniref:Uncharacterized protein n=1 Tax=Methylomonas lenta TaxID=980561 RepID=A0A177NGJ5_9GAMM|nr:hypothetical protein [Methylomonas lenta]OAI16563.1 hypothetical protein A1359_07915 [Methylomonas lenta]